MTAEDSPLRWHVLRTGWAQSQRQVGPGAVVMIEELGQDLAEVALIDDQQPIQALAAGGLDEALQMSVGPWGSVGRPEHTDAFGAEDGIEAIGVLGVAISNQEGCGWVAILEIVSQVAGLLDHPGGVGVGRAGGEQDTAAAKLHPTSTYRVRRSTASTAKKSQARTPCA